MQPWKLRISDTRAEILLYMFDLLRQHSDAFLAADFIEPVTARDFMEVMNWFEKAWDRRQANLKVNEKWSDLENQ